MDSAQKKLSLVLGESDSTNIENLPKCIEVKRQQNVLRCISLTPIDPLESMGVILVTELGEKFHLSVATKKKCQETLMDFVQKKLPQNQIVNFQ